MLTVTLKPELAEQVTHLTNGNQSTIEAFVDQAVREHLHEMARQKIRAETKAFEQQREMLLANYLGLYVAVHDGQVIDHDPDLLALHLRIFDRLGDVTVLLKKVTTKPERDLVVRSRRFVRRVDPTSDTQKQQAAKKWWEWLPARRTESVARETAYATHAHPALAK